jgi:predicted membrane channel-forming protein YqfA (hemolysin III family)
VHFYPQFPSGSIRDTDLGVLNAVMTMGLIGAALIYLPLLVTLVHCMRHARTKARLRFPWVSYGGQIWIVATLASSVTLVTLFSPAGLVLSAAILAVLSQPCVTGGGPPVRARIETEPAHAPPPPVTA